MKSHGIETSIFMQNSYNVESRLISIKRFDVVIPQGNMNIKYS